MILVSTSFLQVNRPFNSSASQTSDSETVLKGVNLGNALEAPEEGTWGVYIWDIYFEKIAAAGFTCVRIPIRWNAHANDSAPYTIVSAFFERIDHLVNESLRHNLTTIINIHHYEEIMQQPEAHKERFLAIWEQIATHFQNHTQKLYFEVLNEPMDKLNNTLWNQYLAEAIDLIRMTNPNRMLIIGPTDWNSFTQLENLELPENTNNLMITFHYYNPFHFTHQNADWVDGSNDWLGTEWYGSEAEKAAIDADFDIAATWAEEYNVPLLLGEFGAYEEADMDSRARWTAYVRSAAEQRGFHWTYWEFAAGFGVYDRTVSKYRDPLLEALLPNSPLLQDTTDSTTSDNTDDTPKKIGFSGVGSSSLLGSFIAFLKGKKQKKKKS